MALVLNQHDKFIEKYATFIQSFNTRSLSKHGNDIKSITFIQCDIIHWQEIIHKLHPFTPMNFEFHTITQHANNIK